MSTRRATATGLTPRAQPHGVSPGRLLAALAGSLAIAGVASVAASGSQATVLGAALETVVGPLAGCIALPVLLRRHRPLAVGITGLYLLAVGVLLVPIGVFLPRLSAIAGYDELVAALSAFFLWLAVAVMVASVLVGIACLLTWAARRRRDQATAGGSVPATVAAGGTAPDRFGTALEQLPAREREPVYLPGD